MIHARKNIFFIIFNEDTGEVDGGCGHCGLHHVSEEQTYREAPVPPGHDRYKLKKSELVKMNRFDRTRNRFEYKIDNPRGQNKKLVKIPAS